MGSCSSPLILFVALLWPVFNRSFSLHWGPRTGNSTGSGISLKRSRGAESPPSACWQCCFGYNPGHSWLSKIQVHIAGSCWAHVDTYQPVVYLVSTSSHLDSDSFYSHYNWATKAKLAWQLTSAVVMAAVHFHSVKEPKSQFKIPSRTVGMLEFLMLRTCLLYKAK